MDLGVNHPRAPGVPGVPGTRTRHHRNSLATRAPVVAALRALVELPAAVGVRVEHRPAVGRSTSWPSCPVHPETHPQALVAGDDDGDARPRWTCPRTGEVLGRLG